MTRIVGKTLLNPIKYFSKKCTNTQIATIFTWTFARDKIRVKLVFNNFRHVTVWKWCTRPIRRYSWKRISSGVVKWRFIDIWWTMKIYASSPDAAKTWVTAKPLFACRTVKNVLTQILVSLVYFITYFQFIRYVYFPFKSRLFEKWSPRLRGRPPSQSYVLKYIHIKRTVWQTFYGFISENQVNSLYRTTAAGNLHEFYERVISFEKITHTRWCSLFGINESV